MNHQFTIYVLLNNKWQPLPGWPISYAYWDNKNAAIKHASKIASQFEDIIVERLGVEVWKK